MPHKTQRPARVIDATDPIRRTIDVLNDDIRKTEIRRDELLAQMQAHQEADEQLHAEALQQKLEQQINALPATEAQVIRLRSGIDALPVEEVAETLGLSVEGVKKLETIARRNLRRA